MIHTSDIPAITQMIVGHGTPVSVFLSSNPQKKQELSRLYKGNTNVLIADFALNGANVTQLLEQYDFIITSETVSGKTSGIRNLRFDFINNRDHTIRWLMPASVSQPLHLKLYNSRTLIGKCYALLTKLFFKVRLRRVLTNGRLVVLSKKTTHVENVISKNGVQDYAIYTGIPGENRKCIVVGETTSQCGEDFLFFKIPLSDKAVKAVENERKTIKKLGKVAFEAFSHPWLMNEKDKSIAISEMVTTKEIKLNQIDSQHGEALKELYNIGTEKQILSECKFHQEIAENFKKMELILPKNNGLNWSAIDKMVARMKELFGEMDPSATVISGTAHGDFTPWNMKATPDNLMIYDWELSNDHTPLLYDLFHFVIQTGILVKRQSSTEIINALDAALMNAEVNTIVNKYQLDVSLHFRLYLLKVTTDYLLNYARQHYVVPQAHWLVETFEKLLKNIKNESENQREQFTDKLFKWLSPQPYVLLKFLGRGSVEVGEFSDIDLLVSKYVIRDIIKGIKSDDSVKKVKIHKKSYMVFVNIFFKDGSFLELDLIHELKRKHVVFLDAKAIIEKGQRNAQGIKLPRLADQFEYIYLFYLLNSASVSDKHAKAWQLLDRAGKEEIMSSLNKKYDLFFNTSDELLHYDQIRHKKVLNYLRTLNHAPRLVLNGGKYIFDTVRDLLFRRGEIITFSGVDGAGKSTVLLKFRDVVESKYRKSVKVLRHRPSVLPILSAMKYGKKGAEQKSVSRLPRSGNNRNPISSIFRFLYYYTDYIIGQWIIYFNYTLRGITVIYDRYYFDFMVDPIRSNIRMPGIISSLGFGLIKKPTLNIFLYADPKIILSRKKELPEEEIKKLTTGYRSLFDTLQRKQRLQYLSIENNDLSCTLQTIEKQYVKNIAA